jgi:hypothetical protein
VSVLARLPRACVPSALDKSYLINESENGCLNCLTFDGPPSERGPRISISKNPISNLESIAGYMLHSTMYMYVPGIKCVCPGSPR